MSQKELSCDTQQTGVLARLFAKQLDKKLPVLAAALLIALVVLPGLRHLTITVNIDDFFLEDDPVLTDQRKFQKLFQTNNFVGVLVESDNVFSRDTLELIKTVSDRLMKEVPLAKETTSLVRFRVPFRGDIALPFANNRLSLPDEAIALYKSFCNASNSLRGVVFSEDNRQAWIRLLLHPYPSEDKWDRELTPLFSVGKAAYDTVRSVNPGNARLTATGMPVYAYRKELEMMNDLVRILVIGALVALLLTIILFRDIQGIAGTLLLICLSTASVFGIQGWLGISMNSAFIAVPVLLSIGVSIGYAVHITRFFKIHFRETGDRRSSVLFALERSAKPILFTAFTTIAALLSFVFVEIKPIQWVGITSALCIFLVYAFSMLLFPVVLACGSDREVITGSGLEPGMIEKILARYSMWLVRYRRHIVIAFFGITALAITGIWRLKVDLNAEQMMGTRLPHMKDQMRIARSEIGVNDTMDLVLNLPVPVSDAPEILKKIERLEKEIRLLPLVKKTSSLAGAVRTLNFSQHGFDRAFETIPRSSAGLRPLLDASLRSDPDLLRSWVNDAYTTTRIFIELKGFSSLEIEKNMTKIRSLAAEQLPRGTTFFFSGSTYQMAVMNQYITRGLVRSVITAFGVITVLMIIVFNSLRFGIIAMIPNIFPVLVAGGVMGFCSLPMEFVTMTVAPMILGLAVDDTIHFLSHLKDDLDRGADFALSVNRAFSVVGTAMTESSLILCASFLVLAFSQVNSINNMGIIACLGIITAYFADLFVTPIIVGTLKRRTYGSRHRQSSGPKDNDDARVVISA